MQNKNLSDVEKFYYAAQAKLGGNLSWNDLNIQDQLVFIQAVNIIKGLTELRK